MLKANTATTVVKLEARSLVYRHGSKELAVIQEAG